MRELIPDPDDREKSASNRTNKCSCPGCCTDNFPCSLDATQEDMLCDSCRLSEPCCHVANDLSRITDSAEQATMRLSQVAESVSKLRSVLSRIIRNSSDI